MAATIRPLFLRPVDYTYTGDAFSVSGGGEYDDFSEGTYANVVGLVHSVCAHLYNNAEGTVLWSFSDDFKIQLEGSGSGLTLEWDDTTLRDILGFTGASTVIPNGSTVTATYTPQYCWIPGFQRADRGGWSQDLASVAVGEEAEDGTWVGIAAGGSTVYRQSILFGMELETNLVISSFDSDEFKRARCLETFMHGALTAMPTSATSANPQGFWFFPDINDCYIGAGTLPATAPFSEDSDDGVHYDTDTRTFCAIKPRELEALRGSPSLSRSTLRYGYSFKFHTAPVPDEGWTYVDKT